MWSSIGVMAVGLAMVGAAAFWVLRAYRRAGGGSSSPAPALLACGAVAVLGLVIYLINGRPELPDAPFEARLEALKQRDPRTYTADEALAVLAVAARENPNDPYPHFYSGQLLLAQGRGAEAARAFDAALRREPRLAEALIGLGRAIVATENGVITPEAIATFRQAATLTDDPAPWIYQALAAMERNDDAEARRLWGEALSRMSEDDPRREMARRMASGEAMAETAR
ncbi:MAG: hypothetical protein K2P58_01810 [Hyphomonadaceae bacterium]|nr:hypothetical protein [Hyphomonadaceae bacterium]